MPFAVARAWNSPRCSGERQRVCWTRTRLCLLSAADRPGLERCLRALLAFLPQGDAFRSLRCRLDAAPSAEAVASASASFASAPASAKSKSSERSFSIEPDADYGRLLGLFRRARRSAVEV